MSLDTVKSESALTHLLFQQSAHKVADYFLSPFIDKEIFFECTREEGPTLWIVNRSDVYDENLELLAEHPIEGIAQRARDKKAIRSGLKLQVLPEVPPFKIENRLYPQDEAEEILGHPLAPFEAMLFFLNDLSEDLRASAALSLTRRLLEHRPTWLGFESLKNEINQSFFSKLLSDPSPYARSFLARIPLFSEEQILLALESETHPYIVGRLMQNPAFKGEAFDSFLKKLVEHPSYAERFFSDSEFEFSRIILFLDKRVPKDFLNLVHRRFYNEVREETISSALLKLRLT